MNDWVLLFARNGGMRNVHVLLSSVGDRGAVLVIADSPKPPESRQRDDTNSVMPDSSSASNGDALLCAEVDSQENDGARTHATGEL